MTSVLTDYHFLTKDWIFLLAAFAKCIYLKHFTHHCTCACSAQLCYLWIPELLLNKSQKSEVAHLITSSTFSLMLHWPPLPPTQHGYAPQDKFTRQKESAILSWIGNGTYDALRLQSLAHGNQKATKAGTARYTMAIKMCSVLHSELVGPSPQAPVYSPPLQQVCTFPGCEDLKPSCISVQEPGI